MKCPYDENVICNLPHCLKEKCNVFGAEMLMRNSTFTLGFLEVLVDERIQAAKELKETIR